VRAKHSTLSPALDVVHNVISAYASDDPLDIRITIVDFLVFGVGRYECEIAGYQLLSFGAVGSPDDGTVAARSIENCV
jgi:hypothetical protein